MELLRGAQGAGADQALEIAVAHAMVRRAGAGVGGPVLRVYRPDGRVVAFGRRDARSPGFAGAARAARDAGFEPVVRSQGGRAVAYTEQSLVVDVISPDDDPAPGLDGRFAAHGDLWADVLRAAGVDARVGAVPGEYCPGAYSVNARGLVKLVGTAQRIVRHGWLFSAVAIVDDAELLRPLLTDVYRHLDLPFDAASVGSIRDESPAISLSSLESAVIAGYDDRFGLVPATLPDDVLDTARTLVADHRA